MSRKRMMIKVYKVKLWLKDPSVTVISIALAQEISLTLIPNVANFKYLAIVIYNWRCLVREI